MQWSMFKRLSYAASLALGLGALITMVVLSGAWQADGTMVAISKEKQIQEKGVIALATSNDEVSVVWASVPLTPGIALAQSTGFDWHSAETDWTTKLIATGQHAQFPAAAYQGEDLSIVWVQSDNDACAVKSLIHTDDNGQSTQVIADDLYLFDARSTLPSLSGSDSGLHLVFFGSPNSKGCANSDLYYSYRPVGTQSTWLEPTAIITHEKVIADDSISGGIWYPQVAYNPASSRIHIVWEQSEMNSSFSVSSSIWYIAGQLDSSNELIPDWTSLKRISPDSEKYGSPNLAVSEDDQVHIVWTKYTGTLTDPDTQYIYYRKLDESGNFTGAPILINPNPILANDDFPSFTAASVDLYERTVCITWYSFVENSLRTAEDVFIRCAGNNGEDWQEVYNVSNTKEDLSISPSLAMDSGGVTHIAWVEYDIDQTTVQPITVAYLRKTQKVYMPLILRR